jgi:hypothetical protein
MLNVFVYWLQVYLINDYFLVEIFLRASKVRHHMQVESQGIAVFMYSLHTLCPTPRTPAFMIARCVNIELSCQK